MIPWEERSREERCLLNPGFCANILWNAAHGYSKNGAEGLSFEESFLILPFVLHREIRVGLPRDTRTSLIVWLNDNPLARGRVVSRARLLVPFTKEAITFGGLHGFIHLSRGKLHAVENWKSVINKTLKESSDEVMVCAKRADFVGRWFAQAGNSTTVLALIGVRP